ncbi:MAG: metal-dependent transcriptional regulator [Candidatus Poseidoniales archaeon]|nr:MAG: metal-dependent transcriptional regulator [Candidatus Poseidoniales archaeon]
MVGHFQEFEDEYLEMMYEFHESDAGGVVRTGDLASKLGVSPASATEMVQRLATRGYLEYIPYKGARLTAQGLVHGQKMKRRHRLAEVLLEILPYDGNPHETACRLEHAIDDDMEVALSRLITSETLDPSGREIPQPTEDIAARLSSSNQTCSLEALADGAAGRLTMLLLPAAEAVAMNEKGFVVGANIARESESYVLENGAVAQLSADAKRSIFVEIEAKLV